MLYFAGILKPVGLALSNALQLDGSLPMNGTPKVVAHRVAIGTVPDDLSREVYGVLGLPIDVLDPPALLRRVSSAVDGATSLLISTPNVHFLIASRSNQEFRDSLLMSDLCLPDGMPIVWIARLLGIPIKQRISGSDLFDALKFERRSGSRLKVFLFGGAEGVAETVCNNLNSQDGGLECVGMLNPGFGSVGEISSERVIETINSSGADLLAVFLSAMKGQAWLLLNRQRLAPPIRAQFGATINFQAGTVERAPKYLREAGMEWLWRIKEEPYLWRRYRDDGSKLLYLILTRVFPLILGARWRRFRGLKQEDQLVTGLKQDNQSVTVSLSGVLAAQYVDRAIPYFREAISAKKQIVIDLSKSRVIDARFFGLFLMLHKHMLGQGRGLKVTGVTSKIKKAFRLNGFDFLLREA
jgi:N-acetylglucosaminyldiphosphoundecaprenol N-acetyl-beta-D-mannosaminyltransferase